MKSIKIGRTKVVSSDLERTFDYYWKILAIPQGAPEPVSEFNFERWFIDRAFPDHKIAVELNGGAGGGFGRKVVCHRCGVSVRAKKKDGSLGRELRIPYPSHSGQGSERDAKKVNRLQESGWVVLTFTSAMMDGDPESCIQEVMIELNKRAAGEIGREKLTASLSKRQKEILRFVCLGGGYDQIAYSMGIKEFTVKKQMVTIREKMGVVSTAQAAAIAVAEGLVSPSELLPKLNTT